MSRDSLFCESCERCLCHLLDKDRGKQPTTDKEPIQPNPHVTTIQLNTAISTVSYDLSKLSNFVYFSCIIRFNIPNMNGHPMLKSYSKHRQGRSIRQSCVECISRRVKAGDKQRHVTFPKMDTNS